MSLQDPISDMLVRIKNAQSRGKVTVAMPYAKQKEAIALVLIEEGYLKDLLVEGEGAKKQLVIGLKYYESQPVIEEIKRISRPSLRKYSSCSELPKVKGGLGVAIISTCKGIMTDKKARQARLGGEVLCSVA